MIDKIMKFFGKRKKPESIIGSKASDRERDLKDIASAEAIIEEARKENAAKYKKKRTLSSQLPESKRQINPLAKPTRVKPKTKGLGLNPDIVDDVIESMESMGSDDSYGGDDD